ncbi:MAG: hypothetical protein ACM3PB_00850, partial [Betaproteobacteria bacterium]
MLRKTAVIAVLILIVSSFTLGSTGRIQTVAAAGNEGYVQGQSAQERGPAFFPTLAGLVTMGHAQAMADLVGASPVRKSRDTGDTTRPIAGFVSVTRVCKTPDTNIGEGYFQGMPEPGVIVDGAPDPGFAPVVMVNGVYVSAGPRTAMSVDGAQGAGFIMVLTNESSFEITGPSTARFMFNGYVFGAHPGSALKDMRSRLADAGAGKYVAHTPVLLYGPDGVQSQRYDMKMESRPGLSGVPGEFDNFTGHLVIPWGGSGVVFGPDGPLPVNDGTIELNSSMLVDMANVTFANATAAKADVYNNEIAGGQTNWHKADISNAVKSFNVDLKWQNVNDSLRLLLYSPDGKILGPYYDNSDG